jgi:hypothetical protein
MNAGITHILLIVALTAEFGSHNTDAIIFAVISSDSITSTRIDQQRSTRKELNIRKTAKLAPIVNLKMTHTVYWFRKALRVHDNPSLIKSIMSTTNLDPIFCLDPWFVKSGRVGVNRMGFLLEALTDLDQNLRKVGSKLLILHGNPVEEIPK